MANILPINTTLPTLQEGASVSQNFSAELLADESLVSIDIIDYQPTPGIEVSGSLYSGVYESVFSYADDALKYRLNDEFKTSASWDLLPDSKEAQLYLWQAPRDLNRTFTYTVLMKYTITTPADPETPGSTPTIEEHELKKVYSQKIVGNWSKWGQQLRDYVYSRN